MDHHLGPSQAEAPCLGGEGAFLFGFTQPMTKLTLRLKQRKLYSMARERRSGDLVRKSTSQPALVWDTVYIGGSRQKGGDWVKRGRNVHDFSENIGVVCSVLKQHPFSVPVCPPPAVAMATVNGHGAAGCYLAANVLHWAYNEVHGLLEVGASAILALADLNQFRWALVFLFWWSPVR